MSPVGAELPRASVVPRPRRSWAFVLPLLALVLAAWLAQDAWRARGPRIRVQAGDGHGIRAGDALVHRGIPVGEVEDVRLVAGDAGVVLTVRLERTAADLARSGSRFWIVRPELSPQGASGLETLVGARHMAVLPGPPGAPPRTSFVALDEPPVEESIEPGGLELVLQAERRGGLAPGSPISYRQMRIGTVLSVGLASDATRVEARAYVRPAFAALVRDDSRFFRLGGLEVHAGLVEGLDIGFDSLASLLSAGIGLATPDEPGAPVTTGHRFELAERAEDDWLAWRPPLPVGSDLLPPGAPLPRPVRARLRWKEGRLIATGSSRQGWLLAVEGGVLGPRDLLEAPADARGGSAVLEIGGAELPLSGTAEGLGAGLARRALSLSSAAWPAGRLRPLTEPEDVLVVGDASAPPLPVAASRLSRTEEGGRWSLDAALPLDASWHGAVALSRRDGAIVAIVVREEDGLALAPVP